MIDENKEKAQRMMHEFKDKIRNIIGRPLFEPEPFEDAVASLMRSLEHMFGPERFKSVEIEVTQDPDDPSRAIVKMTALNKMGEYLIQKYKEKQ